MVKQTVLITGAAGFIGSHLTDRLLHEGWRVIGLDNFCDFYDPAIKRCNLQSALGNSSFTLIESDIRNRQAVMDAFTAHRPGCVVHLAAMAGVRPSIERPSYYADVNVGGTVSVLDAAVASGVDRFVFASSSSIYGNNPKTPFAETDPVDHPISPYAATKKAGELICHTYHHLHRLPILCLRFFTVYGPRQRPDLAISKFLRLVAKGEPIPVYGDGSTSRDYTYVDDIVTGVVTAIDRCRGYGIYNLGGDAPVSLKEMITTIEHVIGQSARIAPQPMQPGDVQRTWADLARSQSDLDYAPQVHLSEGVARQWTWLKKNNPLPQS